jgi:hypothetical protein
MRTILLVAAAAALIVLLPRHGGAPAAGSASARAQLDSKGAQATISVSASLAWGA